LKVRGEIVKFYKSVINDYISAIATHGGTHWAIVNISDGLSLVEVSESEYAALAEVVHNKPFAASGYTYKLRADNLEWELVELPPVPESEPTAEDKAEAYDILLGVTE
jgi:hypothetical protein